MKKYYSLTTNNREADVYIFGDITSWEWFDSDVSSYTLSKELQGLDVDVINVHINSYGGEVAEGLAIYNMLRNHKATIRTICDGFACSIASVIFMAGDERIMNNASLLMIHNAWMHTAGNADQLRKDAEDLDLITEASVRAYMDRINITGEELKTLLDAETWLLPDAALEMGFATTIVHQSETGQPAASAKKALFVLVQNSLKEPEPPRSGVEEVVIDMDILAEKLFARIKEKTEKIPLKTDPPTNPDPKENKPMKLFNALLGGKETNI